MAIDKKSKETFFRELDGLDNLSDGPSGRCESERALMNRARKDSSARITGSSTIVVSAAATMPTAPSRITTPGLSRTVSAPAPAPAPRTSVQRTVPDDQVTVVKETPCPRLSGNPRTRDMKEQKRSSSFSGVDGKLGGGSSRKKRGVSVKTIPESHQIFRGLAFCKSRFCLDSVNRQLTFELG
jgi:hypothetical protein